MTDGKRQADTKLMREQADGLASLGFSAAAEAIRSAADELDELRRVTYRIGWLCRDTIEECNCGAPVSAKNVALAIIEALRADPVEPERKGPGDGG